MDAAGSGDTAEARKAALRRISRGRGLGRRRAGHARRRRLVPALLPADRRRTARGADGRAAAAWRMSGRISRSPRCCAASGSARRRFTPRTAQRGFLLIEDFGDDIYTRLLARGADEARALCAGDRYAGGAAPRRRRARAARRCRPMTRRVCSTRRRCWRTGMRPSVLGAPLPDGGARRISRALAASPAARRAAAGPTLVLRDYHVDNLMLLPGRAGVRACGLLDFQDAVCGPASYDLVSLLEDARRDVPDDLRAAMTERYLAAFPGTRPRRLRALRRDPGRAAQLQDHRHLHAAVAARRQARLSRPYPARLAAARRRCRREPALRPIADWLDRHLPQAAPARSGAARVAGGSRMTGGAENGDGAGRRARHAAAPDHRHDTEAAGRTRRPHPARPCDRPARAGRRRAGRRQRALQGGADRGRARGPDAAPHRAVARGRAARNRRRRGAGAAAARRGVFRRQQRRVLARRQGACAGAARRRVRSGARWTPCCCCIAPRPRSATTAAATIFSTRSGPRAGAASARSRRICSPASSCCTAAPSTASPRPRFSLNRVYDRAEAAGRLHAIVHDGEWYHVGTPDGLAMTRARLSSHRIER